MDDDEWDRVGHDEKYNVSASFLAYLLDAHGPAPFKQVYGASSRAFAAAFQAGMSLTEMEQRWREYVGGGPAR